MRSPFLDDFIERTLDQYEPGQGSGTRIRCAPTAPTATTSAPEPELVDPSDVFDDDGGESEESEQPAPSTPARAVYVPAIRRFAPPRRA